MFCLTFPGNHALQLTTTCDFNGLFSFIDFGEHFRSCGEITLIYSIMFYKQPGEESNLQCPTSVRFEQLNA